MDVAIRGKALWETWLRAAGRFGRPSHEGYGREQLNTIQIYARIYDQTLYRQFREATARLEDLAVDAWPQTITGAPMRAEMEVAEVLSTSAL